MKKIYCFIAMLMLLCTTSTQAQRRWTISETPAMELKNGEEFQYVLQQGFNHNGWASNAYMNSGSEFVHAVDESCIYSFIEVDEAVHGSETYKVYVLKNVKNGMYFAGGEKPYVKSRVDAFKFTARHAVERPSKETDWNNWELFSNGVYADASAGAEAAHAWVFAENSNVRNFICFWKNSVLAGYCDTNSWMVYEATEEELSAYEKLTIAFDEVFNTGVDEDNYPVGTAPGCVSQDFYDRLNAIYLEAIDATSKTEQEADPAACDRIRKAIYAIAEEYKTNMVQVVPGYYILVNGRSGDLAWDNGSAMRCWLQHEKLDAYTLELTNCLWEVVPSKDKGEFYIKNFGTGRYVGKSEGTSKPYAMVADSVMKINAPHHHGVWFLLKEPSGSLHNDAGGAVVLWNSTDVGNRWRFDPVPVTVIDSLKSLVEQNQMTARLSALVNKASRDISGVKLVNGFTDDGVYASAGLVSALEKINCQEPKEGAAQCLFDGNVNSYFHTLWSAALEVDDWHWIQVDFGKPVKELMLKMTHRMNNTKNRPTKLYFAAPENDDLEAPEWLDKLATLDTVIYSKADSTTFIEKIVFSRPAQHVRMVVTDTKNHALNGTRPFWALGELRFYDAAECVPNPLYEMIPAELKAKVDELIAAAKVEIAGNVATQETYDALSKALDNFWDAYPDPEALQDALKNAQKIHDDAVEGTTFALYKEGSKAALQAVIDAISTEIEGKILTTAEIEAYQKRLDEALETFYACLIVPEGGKIYRIVSTTPIQSGGKEEDQTGSCISSLDCDFYNSTPKWAYKASQNVTERFNTLWYVEKTDKGFSFKNLANGLYMNNPFEGYTDEEIENVKIPAILGYSKTPKYFTLKSSYVGGSFLIVAHDGHYVNLQPTGNVVHWWDPKDAHAPFDFVEVVPDEFTESYFIDVTPGAVEIISLPIDINGAYMPGTEDLGHDVSVLKVLGKKDGKIILDSYVDGDLIPAGTPFIAVSEAKDVNGEVIKNARVEAVLAKEAYEDYINGEYNYTAVVQNGLVSAPFGFDMEAGYGYLYQGKVVASAGGEHVAAGSGFFNKFIPETTEEGVFSLVLEGEISGEGTAVEKVEVVKNVPTDVYSLSGVKLRQGVKAASATKNLPKGLYIVGGKKVLVK